MPQQNSSNSPNKPFSCNRSSANNNNSHPTSAKTLTSLSKKQDTKSDSPNALEGDDSNQLSDDFVLTDSFLGSLEVSLEPELVPSSHSDTPDNQKVTTPTSNSPSISETNMSTIMHTKASRKDEAATIEPQQQHQCYPTQSQWVDSPFSFHLSSTQNQQQAQLPSSSLSSRHTQISTQLANSQFTQTIGNSPFTCPSSSLSSLHSPPWPI